MENETITSIHCIIFLSFLAALWGSSLYAAAVRYITDGKKDVNRLSTYLTYKCGHYTHSYEKKQYNNVYTTATHCASAMGGMVAVAIHCVILVALNRYGLLHIYPIVIIAVASLIAALKLSRFVYRINTRLSEHTEDKNLHR